MSLRSNKSALTLVELVLAMLLVNVVILTGLSMEMGMRKIFTGSDVTTGINIEGVAIMAMVTKKINGGIGAEVAGSSPYSRTNVADGTYWTIRQDTNIDGVPDASAAVDIPCVFRYFNSGANQGQLVYYSNVADLIANRPPTLVLTTHCNEFSISSPSSPGPGVPPLGYSIVKLRLRKNISAGISASNPELYFVTRAEYLSTSLG